MTSPRDSYRIIVIDDTESIHEDFRKTLAAPGSTSEADDALAAQEAAMFGEEPAEASPITYEIDSAMQGEEGREMVRAAVAAGRRYAVAFVDMRMPPGWDGLRTIEHLWREDPDLQVVICTAYSDYSWKDIIQRVGVSDKLLILKKPFENIEVSQIAMALCRKWSVTRTANLKLEELESLVERRTAELRHAATHDRLTGLANREFLVQRLRQTLGRRNEAGAFAVLCLDFDRFKLVNDSLGHDTGDQLLRRIADRITDTIQPEPGALAARMGGDEFIVLLEGEGAPERAVPVAERLLATLRAPYNLGRQEVASTASIGITTSAMDYCQPQDVLRHGDLAMYRAKANGRNGYAIFDRTMHDQIVSRLEMEQALRKAVQEQRLCPWYQPVLRLSDGRVVAMEALCRMRRDDQGLASPVDFIPIAEEIGLIHDIGDFMLRRALEQLLRWERTSPRFADLTVSVNLSKFQLLDPSLTDRVAGLLAETGVAPQRLQLEVTESAVMDEPELFAQRMHSLRKLGIRFAMDDFGTGPSSLKCLHQFPIDTLKIDRSFIRSVSENLDYAAIVQAIITLAQNLGMQVVAEGIETHPQLALIQALDCHAAQGFLFSEPRDAAYWNENLATFNLPTPGITPGNAPGIAPGNAPGTEAA